MKQLEIIKPKTKEDYLKQINIGKYEFCLVQYQSVLYVMDAFCPHAGGLLSGGKCKDGYIICPIHFYEYELQSGKCKFDGAGQLRLYPFTIKDDVILITVE